MLILESNIFDVLVPPAGLTDSARDGWLTPTTDATEVGDIWLLTVDGTAHAMALVTKTFDDDFSHVMPVTFGQHAGDMEAVFDDSALGLDLTVWFNAEAGMSEKRFGRRVAAKAFSDETVQALRAASRGGGSAGLEVGRLAREAIFPERERIIDLFYALCFID